MRLRDTDSLLNEVLSITAQECDYHGLVAGDLLSSMKS